MLQQAARDRHAFRCRARIDAEGEILTGRTVRGIHC
jgi:hypothetical protein